MYSVTVTCRFHAFIFCHKGEVSVLRLLNNTADVSICV